MTVSCWFKLFACDRQLDKNKLMITLHWLARSPPWRKGSSLARGAFAFVLLSFCLSFLLPPPLPSCLGGWVCTRVESLGNTLSNLESTLSSLMPRLLQDCSQLQAPPEASAKEIFSSLEWGDKWHDAELRAAIQYIRGSTKLRIPHEWRDLLPKSF